MKNKIAVFFISTFLILMVSPVFNLATRLPGHTDENVKWWELSFLYNVDFAMPLLGSLYSMIGVSLDPGEVILGKDGWMFLGDDYVKSISVKRNGMTPQETSTVAKVADTQAKWDKWYKHHGVKQYRVLIGPDKDSIYPEFLPRWAAHSADPVTAQLLKTAPPGVYVDAFTPLLAAKDKNPPMYYKTDTHWNNLGAWIAFTALGDSLRDADPKLVWPDPAYGKVTDILPQGGGDLAKFQRVQDSTRDQNIALAFHHKFNITVDRYDYDSGTLLSTNQNLPSEPPHHAQLLVSKDALNDKKVLWLRDSYGIAMSPYMAATFSNVLQVHHEALDSDGLIKLVERFKPDYVVYSVVERGSRIGLFVSPPELYAMSFNTDEFVPSAKGTVSLTNDVKPTKTAGRYDITGPDPFIVFSMAPLATGTKSHQLTFDAQCFNPAEKRTPVQIFWSTPTEGFKESNSARFFINQGVTSVDISGAPGWPTTEQVVNVRFDIDSTTACSGFSIKNLATGVNVEAVSKK